MECSIENVNILNDNEMDFMIKSNIELSIFNAIRRSIIADVPTYAIDIVSISKNNGVLKDEILAHRLGLIPIKTNSPIVFKLHVINDTKEIMNVYSSSLKTDDGNTIVIPQNVLITKLGPSQEINLIAKVIKGTGSIHAKWSPSCGSTIIPCDDNSFKVHLETTYAMGPKETFNSAIDELLNKLDSLQYAIKNRINDQ